MKNLLLFLVAFLPFSFDAFSEETSEKEPKKEVHKETPKEETVVTSHTIRINGTDIPYKTTVGTQLLTDNNGDPKATIFYVAYIKDNVENRRERPITFCFNGGPGSASVWLHLGVFGPKRLDIDEEGKQPLRPYNLKDNPFSLLDITDLVFIDPVSTGYSRAVPGEDAKQFHSVEKDIESVASFIRLFTTRNLRWESPKFLAGESYGTTRAAGLALELHDNQMLYLDGIILVSSILNFETIEFDDGNDLPYILFLPTYTATALYHKKLSEELQKDHQKTLSEVEKFALGEYTQALMKGDRLDTTERNTIIEKLSKYTGVPTDYIDRSDMRLHIFRFAKELLRNERRTVGRFDSRLKGIDSDQCDDVFEFDPSFENIAGAFTATFNEYIRAELGWKRDEEYKIVGEVRPWDYGKATNQYLDVGSKLREVMSKNTHLKVFVASACCDLATPYFATDYTFSHLNLDPSLKPNITMKNYEGGHMMYLVYPTLVKLKGDLTIFMSK